MLLGFNVYVLFGLVASALPSSAPVTLLPSPSSTVVATTTTVKGTVSSTRTVTWFAWCRSNQPHDLGFNMHPSFPGPVSVEQPPATTTVQTPYPHEQSYPLIPPEAEGYDGFLPGATNNRSPHSSSGAGNASYSGQGDDSTQPPRKKRNRLTLSCTHCRYVLFPLLLPLLRFEERAVGTLLVHLFGQGY